MCPVLWVIFPQTIKQDRSHAITKDQTKPQNLLLWPKKAKQVGGGGAGLFLHSGGFLPEERILHCGRAISHLVVGVEDSGLHIGEAAPRYLVIADDPRVIGATAGILLGFGLLLGLLGSLGSASRGKSGCARALYLYE